MSAMRGRYKRQKKSNGNVRQSPISQSRAHAIAKRKNRQNPAMKRYSLPKHAACLEKS
jgi:hypothetical protein